MGKLDDVQFISPAQLKQVMLANADKIEKRYLKKEDYKPDDFARVDALGELSAKDKVGVSDLDNVLAATIDSKADAADVITQETVDAAVATAMESLGDLATLDVVSEEDLSDGLANKINDVYTKAEVYTKEETFTKDEVNAAINSKVGTVYRPAGSCASTELPELEAGVVGNVYNVTNTFTTDARFIEEGVEVKAGSNVAVVEVAEGEYLFDVLAGFIDMSGYLTEDDIQIATSAQINDIIDSIFAGTDTNPDPEVVDVVLTSTESLGEISKMFTEGVTSVNAKLNADITVPARDDGKISTTMVSDGQKVTLDLNGHHIDTQAYAMYVNTGGELIIEDTSGEGVITTSLSGVTYPAVYNNGGKVTMNSGTIDTRHPGEDVPFADNNNWMYGIVCSGDGIFEMNGGTIHTDAASCISITNGTSSGEGAQFIIGGDAHLITDNSAAIYLADNKSVIIKDNAVVEGGIIARMGTIEIKDNAKVINEHTEFDDYGTFLVSSGVVAAAPAVIGLVGCYKTNAGVNDMDIIVSGNATVESATAEGIVIDRLDTLYDQVVNVTVEDSNNITVPEGFDKVKVREHEELAEIAAASGKTLPDKKVETDVTVTVDGTVVYDSIPDVEGDNEEPEVEP